MRGTPTEKTIDETMTTRSLLQVVVAKIPPQGLELKGEVPAENFDFAGDDRLSVPAPVDVDLQVTKVSSGVLCRGQIRVRLRCRCDRCLAYFTHELNISDACCFMEDADVELVDLTPSLREDILLAFPQGLLCRDDCRGLCPQCGQNLNVRKCSCHGTNGSGGVWSVLENLDLSPEEDTD
jgi:uncharacterized protein